MRKKKKGHFLCITGREDQIVSSAKFLNITHESYGFSADKLETITNEYQCRKPGFIVVIINFVVMCEDSRYSHLFECIHINSIFLGPDSYYSSDI